MTGIVSSPAKEIICVRGLSGGYEGYPPVIHGLDLSIRAGEMVLLCGPSGAGKTTFLYMLLGVVRAESGELWVAGVDMKRARYEELRQVRMHTGVVFQNFRLFGDLSVYENVGMSLRVLGIRGSELKRRSLEAIEVVGLAGYASRKAAELSWGQKQRVAIARAIVRRPALILADEPTGNLDEENTAIVCELLAAAQREGSTVIAATHDPLLINNTLGRKLTLTDGRVVA